MKAKHIFLLSLCFFLAMTACTKNDDSEGNEVSTSKNFYGTEVPYTPSDINNLPFWLQTRISEDPGFTVVYCGKKDGEEVYNLHHGYDASSRGYFYDKDGNPICVEDKYGESINIALSDVDVETFINSVKGWKCIYYGNQIYQSEE
jgi:hypothetical protein